MINEKNPLLNIQLNKEVSKIKTMYKEFVDGLYSLFCLMLDDPIENFWYECISMSLGYFQLLIYIIDETVRKIFLYFTN